MERSLCESVVLMESKLMSVVRSPWFPFTVPARRVGGIALLSFSMGLSSPGWSQDTIETGAIERERVLAAEPETNAERFDAALLMVKLARPNLAKLYLRDLLAENPDDAELLALRDKYGTSVFISLTNVEGLSPEADQLLKRLTDAVSAKTNDPQYVTRLLPKLEGTARQKEEALTELRALGPYAVPPLLQALELEGVNRATLTQNLIRLGDAAVPPLLGALTSPSPIVRAVAAEVLGWSGTEADLIFLWSLAFDENEPDTVREVARKSLARNQYGDPRLVQRVDPFGVPARLLQIASSHLRNRYEWPVRYEDLQQIPVWTWDANAGTVVETWASRRHASIHFAERLARESALMAPTNEDAPLVVLAALMVRDIEEAGWDHAVPTGPETAFDVAVRSGEAACLQVLQFALDHDIPAAALNATLALGLNGSRSSLHGPQGKPAIIAALDAAHPRVQFAAAVTILQWEPNKPFPHARRVVEILARGINSDTRPESVVVDPNPQRATLTASLFRELGYDASIANTGRDGFLMASAKGDIELAVLHPNTRQWELTQTIENLRADVRTKNLPLVIYGPASLRDNFHSLQSRFQNVVYVNESNSSIDIHRDLRPVMHQLTPPPLTPEQRNAQLQEAAYWLRWIATSSPAGLFDLAPHVEELIQATKNPIVADDAIITLGAIGLPDVQRRMLQIIEAPAIEAAIAKRAALQLAAHIQQYGILLTPGEQDRVIAAHAAASDPALQLGLASVLGSLKAKPAVVRKQILATPMSAKPIASDATADDQDSF